MSNAKSGNGQSRAVKGHNRYKVYLVAMTPDQALVTHIDKTDGEGVWVPAKRVVYFEGRQTHVDLTDGEARALGYAVRDT